jgi:hypothetical protein
MRKSFNILVMANLPQLLFGLDLLSSSSSSSSGAAVPSMSGTNSSRHTVQTKQTHSWRDPAVGLGGWPDLGRLWVCKPVAGSCFFLLLHSFFSFPFSFFSKWENQLQHPLDFFCAICSLYVRCHSPSGCCKTHLLQMDRIVGFLINILYKKVVCGYG